MGLLMQELKAHRRAGFHHSAMPSRADLFPQGSTCLSALPHPHTHTSSIAAALLRPPIQNPSVAVHPAGTATRRPPRAPPANPPQPATAPSPAPKGRNPPPQLYTMYDGVALNFW
jgi:hypothetical protein